MTHACPESHPAIIILMCSLLSPFSSGGLGGGKSSFGSSPGGMG